MASEFSRTLSLLRRERGVSQRTAAGDLGISQALLSHYENGVREPGLSFVVKACDYYNVSAEAKDIAWDLMNAILFIVIFQSMNSILTKGVLRAGGDTKFLMAGDILFLWVASVPLGALAGLVLDLPAFWVYTFLKIDQIIKCVWCYFRLKSGKWLKKIKPAK